MNNKTSKENHFKKRLQCKYTKISFKVLQTFIRMIQGLDFKAHFQKLTQQIREMEAVQTVKL